ncbi:MAG: hypothetical protein ACE5KU_02820, partial [Nitrososphaerales archaeon]
AMQGWRCERCGFTHIAEAVNKIPRRCPSCRSTRVRRIIIRPGGDDRYELSSRQIYGILDRISDIPVQEQEEARKMLKESGGVHVLCLDERKDRLRKVLTRNEVEGYLSLIRNQNFGLAVIGRSVVAVSPDSPIRPHVGVNRSKLDELEDLSKT